MKSRLTENQLEELKKNCFYVDSPYEKLITLLTLSGLTGFPIEDATFRCALSKDPVNFGGRLITADDNLVYAVESDLERDKQNKARYLFRQLYQVLTEIIIEERMVGDFATINFTTGMVKLSTDSPTTDEILLLAKEIQNH